MLVSGESMDHTCTCESNLVNQLVPVHGHLQQLINFIERKRYIWTGLHVKSQPL